MDKRVSEEFNKLTKKLKSFRNIYPCLHVKLVFKPNYGKTIHVDEPNVVIDKINVEKEPKIILKSANINYEYDIVMLNYDFQRYNWYN